MKEVQSRRGTMSWIENLLIVAGTSLEIFAAMECQGSLVSKVNKKQLSKICVLIAIFQLVSMYIGYFLSTLLLKKNPVSDEALLGEILSIVILICLGIRLVVKAVKNERIEERLQEHISMKRAARIAAVTSIYTILAGIAFGFLNTGLLAILIMVVVLTIVCIIAGVYTGYHFGFEQKTKVYFAGAILFWIAGIDIIIRCVLKN